MDCQSYSLNHQRHRHGGGVELKERFEMLVLKKHLGFLALSAIFPVTDYFHDGGQTNEDINDA